MICPNCSTVLADDSQQCTNCGARLVPATEYPYGATGADVAEAAAAGAVGAAAAGAAPFQAGQATGPAGQVGQMAGQAGQAAGPSAFRQGFEQGYEWAQGRQQTDAQQSYTQAYQQGYEHGYQQAFSGQYQVPVAPVFPEARKNHIVAGLLAIFLGVLGIHKYYLGYTTQGTIMLLVTLIGSIFTFGLAYLVMAIIALIEGIIYLTKDDATFYYTYELGQKPWF